MATESITTFSAALRLPAGHTAAPVLDSPGAARLPACTILPGHQPEAGGSGQPAVPGRAGGLGHTEAGGPSYYSLQLSQLTACGVRPCRGEEEEEGDTWLCLLVRFPILAGIAEKKYSTSDLS